MRDDNGAADMAVVCDVCAEVNDADLGWCFKCRSHLPDEQMSRPDAQRESARRKRIVRRRKILGWTIIVSVVLGLAGWWVSVRYLPVWLTADPSTALSVVSAPGDWPMYQRDPAHTGFAEDVREVPQGVLRWSFETDRQLFASPSVAWGVAYIGTGDGRLLALDGQTGEIVWEVDAGDAVHSTPAVAGDLVFFGLLDGRVVALERSTGRQAWEFVTEGSVVASPTVFGGFVYIGSGSGVFYALDAATGEQIWSRDTNRWIGTSAAVFEDVVAFVSYDRLLYILDRHNGTDKLRFTVTGSPRGSASFGEEHLFIGEPSGSVKAVDWHRANLPFDSIRMRFANQFFLWGIVGERPKQRGFAWGAATGLGVFSTPVVGNGMVYATDFAGRIVAIDEAAGEILWLYDSVRPIVASASATPDLVLAGDTDGVLHALDAETGEVLWRFVTGAQISASPVLAGGLVYVASEDGTLYVLE